MIVIFGIEALLGILWNVITVSLRQTIIPPHLLGRVNSVYRFFAWGMMPIGAAFGGVLVWLIERQLGSDLSRCGRRGLPPLPSTPGCSCSDAPSSRLRRIEAARTAAVANTS